MQHEIEVVGDRARELLKHQMAVMDSSGDTKVIWDKDAPAEVEAARAQFNMLKSKGYSAFKVDKKGDAGTRIDEFDPSIEKMIMVPQLKGG